MKSLDWYITDDAELDPAPRRKSRKPKRSRAEILAEIVEPETNIEGAFDPSFRASRHERAWIQEYLTPLYNDHLITDVLRPIKGGKEATVYCCEAHPATGVAVLAAKLYRPRMFRNLRNDAQYRAGRIVLDEDGKQVRDGRRLPAIAKGTGYGQELQHASWLAHEHHTLTLLHAAGADVPRPWALNNNVILMEHLGDAAASAHTLNHVRLADREARALFDRLLHNIDLMLAHHRVHGDLSAYNVLYWQGDIRIIDFPQAVDPWQNPDAFTIFERDVRRLCQYFEPYGIDVDSGALARDLWRKYLPLEQVPIEAVFDDNLDDDPPLRSRGGRR
jgi:RIO kinase 1